jgi:hypothetical protein
MRPIAWLLVPVFMGLTPAPAKAAAGFELGSNQMGTCRDLIRMIRGEWFDARQIIAPDRKTRTRPREDAFQCVSAGYAYNAMTRSSPASKVQCYTKQANLDRAICCDRNVTMCAIYTQPQEEIDAESAREAAYKAGRLAGKTNKQIAGELKVLDKERKKEAKAKRKLQKIATKERKRKEKDRIKAREERRATRQGG